MPETNSDNILQEHFWFTATALGANAFLMVSDVKLCHWLILPGVSTIISVYAVYLIVERSASAAKKIQYPNNLPEPEDRTWKHKLIETKCRLKRFVPHIGWIACELSGAFFYFLLVVTSCAGVWIARCSGC
jgi:hypothetical protein